MISNYFTSTKFNFSKIHILFIVLLYFSITQRWYAFPVRELNDEIKKVKDIAQLDIRDVFKDSKGFLWLATSDGLVRYNGLDSKIYRVGKSENTIGSNMTRKITEDKWGNIWVSTFGKGLSKLDIKKEKFTNYTMESEEDYRIETNDISSFLIDDHCIWIGNWDRLIRVQLDDANDKIKGSTSIPLSEIDHSLHQVVVQTIFKGKDNEIWLGLNTGLVRINNSLQGLHLMDYDKTPGNVSDMTYCEGQIITSGEFISLLKRKNQSEFYLRDLIYNSGQTIAYQDGIVWVGNRKGVFAYAYHQQQLQLLKHFQTSSNNGKSHHPVTSIVIDKNQVWVATTGGGVYSISDPNLLFEHYQQTNKNSLYDDHIKAIFEDSEQNLWIGTEVGGLNYLIGKNKYNYENGFGQLSVKNYPVGNNRVYAIAEQHLPHSKIRNKLIWLGTTFPTFLVALDPKTMQLLPQSPFAKKLGFVFDIEIQNDSILWLGTYNEGLWRLKTNQDGEIRSAQQFDSNDENGGLTSDIIRSILLDSNGNLFIGTDKGLNLIPKEELDKQHPEIYTYREGKTKYDLPSEYLLKIFEAKNGTIWIGTIGGGLIHFDSIGSQKRIVFHAITTAEGLVSNSIKSIEEDEKGCLWLSSNQGLIKYDPVSNKYVNYNESDGLQANEFEDLVSCRRKDGQMLFGGVNGLNTFYPSQIVNDSTRPHLYFSELQILNETIAPNKKYGNAVILENSIEHTDKINLSHSQNSFTISFEAFQFNHQHKVKFRYKLEGFDEKWTRTRNNSRQAKYTNIPAGKYTLKVNAANSDEVWLEQPIALEINIARHPLLSSWALVFYSVGFIVFCGIVLTIYNRIRKQKRDVFIAELEKKNAEEAAQSKLRFFTNISHEFRTPLTLITIPIDRLINSTSISANESKRQLKIIKYNADLMLRLVNQILDFRKLEQNKMQLSMQSINIVKFIDSILVGFQPLAETKEVDLQFIPDRDEINMSFDPDFLEKIINNLLSNAIKFTPKKGRVTLVITPFENKVLIKVSDTGIGINEKDKEHLFKRYFQKSEKNKFYRNGSGIGLNLIKNLVELHNGTIEVDSEEGKGTTFKVYLPKINEGTITEELSKEMYTEEAPSRFSIDTLKDELLTSSKKYTFLIVEDNEELRATIASIFNNNHRVIEAEDGQQGYEKCVEHLPDIVISDVMMPKMNGLELLHTIKNDLKVSHIPVVLLTAKSTNENKIEGLMEGADAYVSKPFDQNVLYSMAFSILKNRERLIEKFDREIKINPSLISKTAPDVEFINKILSIIENNLDDTSFNVDRLSIEYGLSRNHLNKKIKALTGETTVAFIRNIRLKHAAELFQNGNTNISEVTWKVGYSDLGTFRKRFKEKFGVSPSEFVQEGERKVN
ncbi:hybrid sensor histidine kinase/response regulator transcription factor [Flammeovirga sp. OC4]|uniref:hybrid sensor histidine kinase/response regulator transcription factor n=1 Tax=Flammeovirga sp. OC4 TaxID=1382345 RepID=UPI0005C4B68D|nr:hybrid sensor histidine kinase/response regulator transcription factor [Flammeovirga sp. OC4]